MWLQSRISILGAAASLALSGCNHGVTSAISITTSEDSITQFSLGEFEVLLTPTPQPLTDVDNVLGPAIEAVVRADLQVRYGENFEYMHIASLDHISTADDGTRRALRVLQNSSPYTAVTYVGGVVAFDDDPSDDVLNVVKTALESGLTAELAANGGAWESIETVQFVDLSSPDAVETTQTDPPETTAGINVAETAQDIASTPRSRRIAGGFFGIAFVTIGAILFTKSSRRLRGSKKEVVEEVGEGQLESIPEDDDTTVYAGKIPRSGNDGVSSDAGNQSDAARYGKSNDILDNISVGVSLESEWTINTNDISKASGGTSNPSLQHPAHGGAMASASSETFERDRLVTLQKDILQSEWTAVRHNQTATKGSLLTATASAPARKMNFEHAYDEGQGEEIYLVPPSSTTRTRREIV